MCVKEHAQLASSIEQAQSAQTAYTHDHIHPQSRWHFSASDYADAFDANFLIALHLDSSERSLAVVPACLAFC